MTGVVGDDEGGGWPEPGHRTTMDSGYVLSGELGRPAPTCRGAERRGGPPPGRGKTPYPFGPSSVRLLAEAGRCLGLRKHPAPEGDGIASEDPNLPHDHPPQWMVIPRLGGGQPRRSAPRQVGASHTGPSASRSSGHDPRGSTPLPVHPMPSFQRNCTQFIPRAPGGPLGFDFEALHLRDGRARAPTPLPLPPPPPPPAAPPALGWPRPPG